MVNKPSQPSAILLAGFGIVRTIKNKPNPDFLRVCHRHPTRKVMDCFSSSNITDNFCHINDAKCHSNIFKISTQCYPSRASECECKLLLNNLHSSGISRKNQMLSRVCYFIE